MHPPPPPPPASRAPCPVGAPYGQDCALHRHGDPVVGLRRPAGRSASPPMAISSARRPSRSTAGVTTAILDISSLACRIRSIVASYSGDVFSDTSTSPAVVQVIQPGRDGRRDHADVRQRLNRASGHVRGHRLVHRHRDADRRGVVQGRRVPGRGLPVAGPAAERPAAGHLHRDLGLVADPRQPPDHRRLRRGRRLRRHLLDEHRQRGDRRGSGTAGAHHDVRRGVVAHSHLRRECHADRHRDPDVRERQTPPESSRSWTTARRPSAPRC